MSDVAVEHICRELRLLCELVEKQTAEFKLVREALSHITDVQLDHESRLSELERHVYGNSAANGAGE